MLCYYNQNLKSNLAICDRSGCYVLNRSIARKNVKTPVEILIGKKSDVTKLRVFGCITFRHISKKFRMRKR